MKKLILPALLTLVTLFSNAQNVGIGTSIPAQKLHVAGAAQTIRIDGLSGVGIRSVFANANGDLTTVAGSPAPDWMVIGNGGTNPINNFVGTTDNVDLRFRTFNTERITIKNTGSIGLFTNNPVTSWLHSIPPSLANDFQFKWDNNLSSDAPARFQNSLSANGNRVFLAVTNYNTTGFIATACMGLAFSNVVTPTLAGAEGVRGYNNSTSGIGVFAGYTGGTLITSLGWALYANGWAGGLSAWQNVSDGRLKKNIVTIPNALDKVKQLRGVEYNFNSAAYPELKLSDKEKKIGFIAQEVEAIFPELVVEKGIPYNEGELTADFKASRGSYNLKTVSYSELVPVLVEAIKEQQQQIEELKARVAKLEGKK